MTVFRNAKAVFPDKIRSNITVAVDGGKIVYIGDRFDAPADADIIDAEGLYLSPGFIDIHVHGGGGFSAMSENPEDIVAMSEAHLRFGTTSIVPTTLASPVKRLVKAIESIKAASQIQKRANILGVHLEGPYLSLEYKGAQSATDILNPLKDSPEELFEAWRGGIRMMGAAPEEDGCMELGRKIVAEGAVASIAHSGASYECVEEAMLNGYSDVTHIYSACSSCFKVNLFRVGGVVEAGLSIEGLTTQTIADLRHLPAGILKLIYKCKGSDKMILITDGLDTSALEMKEGELHMQDNGVEVVYEDGVMKLSDRSSLAGSVATSSRLVRNMYKTVGVPLYDAVRSASLTPAERIGFGKQKGRIANGYDADIILFDDDINIKTVMNGGKII